MEWKDSDLDFTKNCIFIDEAGFHINMRNNWARSKSGSSAIAKQPKNRAQLIPLSGLFTRLALFTLSYENFHQEKKHRLLKKRETLIMERREPQS